MTRRLPGGPALLFVIAACGDQHPARLAVPDTVVVNSRQPTRLPVDVRNAEGHSLGASGLRYELVSGDHVQLSDSGAVTCSQPADATIRVTRAELSTRVVVRCRPIRGFRLPSPVRLLTTDPPHELTVDAVGLDGNPVTVLAGAAVVRDTQIVVLRKGQLYPKARGATDVDVTAGDCSIAIRIEVIERTSTPGELTPNQEFATALRLVSGEIRSWRIPAGRYELELVSAPTQRQHLVLAGTDMRCSSFPGEPERQHYSCVAHAGAAVIVRHPKSAGSGAALGADLYVRRWDDPANVARRSDSGDRNRRADACPTIIQ